MDKTTKINYGTDDLERETKLRIDINAKIGKVTLVADVGGLSLRISFSNLFCDFYRLFVVLYSFFVFSKIFIHNSEISEIFSFPGY